MERCRHSECCPRLSSLRSVDCRHPSRQAGKRTDPGHLIRTIELHASPHVLETVELRGSNSRRQVYTGGIVGPCSALGPEIAANTMHKGGDLAHREFDQFFAALHFPVAHWENSDLMEQISGFYMTFENPDTVRLAPGRPVRLMQAIKPSVHQYQKHFSHKPNIKSWLLRECNDAPIVIKRDLWCDLFLMTNSRVPAPQYVTHIESYHHLQT